MPDDLPGSVLFACTQNVIRSPMAEGLMRHLFRRRVYAASCGVRSGEPDPFVAAVMEERGIDLSRHRPRSFDDLDDTSFDMIVSLSPEAHHSAMEMTRTMAIEVEYWPTLDPSVVAGSREQILDSYRGVRDALQARILGRFRTFKAPGV